MSRNRSANPFAGPPREPPNADAAQRIVDLEAQLAACDENRQGAVRELLETRHQLDEMTARAAAAEAQVARTLRACWVDSPDGKRHTVRAKDAQAAVAQIGVGSIFRGYIA